MTAPVPTTVTAQPPEEEGIDCSPCCANEKCRSDMLSCRSGEDNIIEVFRKRGWKYFLLAFVDVEANYLLVRAYSLTNITSITVLDCFTIPVVLVLSWLFLSVRYLISHIIGVFICLLGIACLIWADAIQGRDEGTGQNSNRLVGDILTLVGASLYGVSNVAEEYLVKSYNRVEYLGMVGLFGMVISGIQLAIVERNAIASVKWSASVLSMYALYAGCLFSFYSLVSVFLRRSSAVIFNLSLLTTDFYSLIFGILLFKLKFHLLYFVSFAVVIVGAVIYSLYDTHVQERNESRCLYNYCCFCCCCPGESNSGSLDLEHIAPGDSSRGARVVTIVEDGDPRGLHYCPVHGRLSTRPNSAIRNRADLPPLDDDG